MRSLQPSRSLILRRFLLLLFALQAAVPMGTMPVYGADGPTIVLCTGRGQVRVALPEDATPAMIALAEAAHDDGESDPTDGRPCDFAALNGALTIGEAITITDAVPHFTPPAFPPAGLVAIGQGLVAPPPPSTGPPLSS